MRAALLVVLLARVPTATAVLCDDSCLFSLDDECDDGGSGSSFFFCAPGTDRTARGRLPEARGRRAVARDLCRPAWLPPRR